MMLAGSRSNGHVSACWVIQSKAVCFREFFLLFRFHEIIFTSDRVIKTKNYSAWSLWLSWACNRPVQSSSHIDRMNWSDYYLPSSLMVGPDLCIEAARKGFWGSGFGGVALGEWLWGSGFGGGPAGPFFGQILQNGACSSSFVLNAIPSFNTHWRESGYSITFSIIHTYIQTYIHT